MFSIFKLAYLPLALVSSFVVEDVIVKGLYVLFADVEDGKSFIPIVTLHHLLRVLKSGTNLLIAKNISG